MIKPVEGYKACALAELSGKWGSAILMMLAYLVLQLIVGFVFGLIITVVSIGAMAAYGEIGGVVVNITERIIASFIYVPFAFGISMSFIGFVRHKNSLLIERAFADGYDRMAVAILRNLYTILWACLLFVPGIIKAYSYILTPYIVWENPGISANSAIDMSRSMMKGHKFEMFLVHLHILWWWILLMLVAGIGVLICYASISSGYSIVSILLLLLFYGLIMLGVVIGVFYLMPIVECAQALFYEDLLEEKKEYSTTTSASSSEMKF